MAHQKKKMLHLSSQRLRKTDQDILELIIGLKKSATGTIKEYRACLEKFRQHNRNDYLLRADKEAASDLRTHLLSK